LPGIVAEFGGCSEVLLFLLGVLFEAGEGATLDKEDSE
jgi:hypothetical protein